MSGFVCSPSYAMDMLLNSIRSTAGYLCLQELRYVTLPRFSVKRNSSSIQTDPVRALRQRFPISFVISCWLIREVGG